MLFLLLLFLFLFIIIIFVVVIAVCFGGCFGTIGLWCRLYRSNNFLRLLIRIFFLR